METSKQKMMKVEVYYNRRRKMFSVRSEGRVIAHTPDIFLIDCAFIVQPGGQRKTRETGVRNVHAWMKGQMLSSIHGIDVGQCSRYIHAVLAITLFARMSGWKETSVHYNPLKNDTFVDEQKQEIKEARVARLFFEKDRPVIIAYIEGEI